MQTTSRLCSMVLLVFFARLPALSAAEIFKPVYRAPNLHESSTRIGGNSRGAASSTFLNVLAPDHTGLTLIRKPTLYWHRSGGEGANIEVVITDEKADEPVLQKSLKAVDKESIEAFTMEKYGVRLSPNVEYRWSVTLLPDGSGNTPELFAAGTIKLVADKGNVKKRLQKAPRPGYPSVYADEGLWYDALMELDKQLTSARTADAKRALHEQRAYLLDQVGLREAARYDRSVGR